MFGQKEGITILEIVAFLLRLSIYIYIYIYLSQQSQKRKIDLMLEDRHFPLPQIESQTISKNVKIVDMKLHYQIKLAGFLFKVYDLD